MAFEIADGGPAAERLLTSQIGAWSARRRPDGDQNADGRH